MRAGDTGLRKPRQSRRLRQRFSLSQTRRTGSESADASPAHSTAGCSLQRPRPLPRAPGLGASEAPRRWTLCSPPGAPGQRPWPPRGAGAPLAVSGPAGPRQEWEAGVRGIGLCQPSRGPESRRGRLEPGGQGSPREEPGLAGRRQAHGGPCRAQTEPCAPRPLRALHGARPGPRGTAHGCPRRGRFSSGSEKPQRLGEEAAITLSHASQCCPHVTTGRA